MSDAPYLPFASKTSVITVLARKVLFTKKLRYGPVGFISSINSGFSILAHNSAAILLGGIFISFESLKHGKA
jgi:hypothetical protein